MTDKRVTRGGWQTGARYRTVPETMIRDTLARGGWAFELRSGDAGVAQGVADMLDVLVRQGLPYREIGGDRYFDPVETTNFLNWSGLADLNSFWPDRFVSTGRRLVDEADSVSRSGLASFTVDFRRRFGLADATPDRPLRLRVPLPVPHASLSNLHVAITQTGGLDCAIAPDRCRIEARGPSPRAASVTIGARLTFALDSRAGDHEGGDLDRFLSPRDGFIEVTPRVSELAATLTADARDRHDAVTRCFDFILDGLCLGAVHYNEVRNAGAATDWVLETGWFDCQLGGALLAALCRARDIPARLVGGFHLYRLAPTQHFWTEVWFPEMGWLPFDLACWDLSLGGRDPGWRTHFAGRLDWRLITQRPPLQFTGAPGIPFPDAWHVLPLATPDGVRTGVYAVDDQRLIFEDEIAVLI